MTFGGSAHKGFLIFERLLRAFFFFQVGKKKKSGEWMIMRTRWLSSSVQFFQMSHYNPKVNDFTQLTLNRKLTFGCTDTPGYRNILSLSLCILKCLHKALSWGPREDTKTARVMGKWLSLFTVLKQPYNPQQWQIHKVKTSLTKLGSAHPTSTTSELQILMFPLIQTQQKIHPNTLS